MAEWVQLDLLDAIAEVEKKDYEARLEEAKKDAKALRLFHKGTSSSIEDYVTKMLNYEQYYDLREDELLNDLDVVGHCMFCGKDVTVEDMCRVNAYNWIWKHKDGSIFNAYSCFGKHNDQIHDELHARQLELCDITEQEYLDRLEKEQPGVFTANGYHKQLCRKWKDAEKNDAGVFTTNSRAYPAGSRKDCFLELCVALKYPMVYCEMDLESVKDSHYGSYSPLTDESQLFSCNVADDPWQVECKLTTALTARICDNKNLCDDSIEKFLKLVDDVVKKAMEDMKNEH